MSHHTVAGLIVALGSSSVMSPAGAPPPAPAVDVEVSLVSVVPGTEIAPGHWCVGAGPVRLTAHAVELITNTELRVGAIEREVCDSPRGGFPKEVCDDTAGGSARWRSAGSQPLFVTPTPSILHSPMDLVRGWRLLYLPERHSGYEKGAMSASFDIGTTCAP